MYIFLELRDDYSNDLPQEMLHILREQQFLREQQSQREENIPIDYNKYKCGANYICGLASRLEAVVERGIVTDLKIIKKIDEFRNHSFDYYINGKYNSRTTQEEIDMINDILNDVIDYLQNIVDQKKEEA